MTLKVSVRAIAALATAAVAGVALAQAAGPAHDYKAAPAGTYAIDPSHTGLVVRVPHGGFSYSVFRFTAVNGQLAWDPANPRADKLQVTVDPKDIETAPTGINFADEIANKFLKVAQFPTATFASTAFHADSATHGTVEGDLTVAGVTKHVTFDVDLVGAGKGFHGQTIGVTARAHLDPKDYGLPAFMSGQIDLIIDTEFDQKAG